MDEVEAEAQMKRWRKRRRRIAIAVPIVLILAGFLYWFPPWAIKRAHKNAVDCTNQIYRTGKGNAADCRQGALLAIPKLIPWTRKKALAEQSTILGQELEDALDLTVKRDLDRAAAARGVKALFAALDDNPKLDTLHAIYYIVLLGGDERALIEHAAQLHKSSDVERALQAAIHAGDREAIGRIAKVTIDDEGAYSLEKERGALLCVLGDKAGGTAALTKAIELWGKFGDTGYLEAQLAMAVCNPSVDVGADDVWRGRIEYAKQIGGAPPSALDDKYQNEADIPSLVALDRRDVSDLNEYLKIIAPDYGDATQVTFQPLSPWSILSSEGEYPGAPDWDDAVATRLIGFADKFVPPKPKKHKRGDDYESPYGDYDIDDAAEKEPRPILRWSAMVASLEAAVGWMRRGDATHAEASLDVAIACANHAQAAQYHPYTDLLLISVMQLVGRDADALALVDATIPKIDPADANVRGILAVHKATLLLHAGKPAEAWGVFDSAVMAAADRRITWNLTWLKAAAAVMLDKPLDIDLPAVPDKRDYSQDHPEVNLAYWYTAATDPSVQASRRWHHDGLDPGYFDNWSVLPALLFVAGKAAGKGDVELWLDVLTVSEIIPWETLASARAEAARWRGDTAAATAWDHKLAAYHALATDDRTAYLLRLAQKN